MLPTKKILFEKYLKLHVLWLKEIFISTIGMLYYPFSKVVEKEGK